MNKYEEALDRIALNYGLSALDESNEIMDSKFSYDISLMIELVDKEKPIQPRFIEGKRYSCPSCAMAFELPTHLEHRFVNNSYCDVCGQKLDWRD